VTNARRRVWLLACSALLFSGCKSADHTEDVKASVVGFYNNHQSNYRDVDRNLLSRELKTLLEKSIAREKLEAEWTAKSTNPTDKPFSLEADVFASHLEGEFGFAVDKITVNGKQANVTMDFTSTFVSSNEVEKWSEAVIMIDEGVWKVDDIIYPAGDRFLDGSGTLKTVLADFINTTEAQAHPSN
jgi:hypothetical protein